MIKTISQWWSFAYEFSFQGEIWSWSKQFWSAPLANDDNFLNFDDQCDIVCIYFLKKNLILMTSHQEGYVAAQV